MPNPLPQQGEVSVQVHVTSVEEFPNVYTEAEANEVIETDSYQIFDIFHENVLGNTLWTTVYFTLQPWKQIPKLSFHVNAHYQMREGNILFILGTATRVLLGDSKEAFTVPAGTEHILWNQRQDKESRCVLQVPARLDLREHLGTTMPGEKRQAEPPRIPTVVTPPATPIVLPQPPLKKIPNSYEAGNVAGY